MLLRVSEKIHREAEMKENLRNEVEVEKSSISFLVVIQYRRKLR